MRAHYITEHPSGYRGRLFPLDNRGFFLSGYTVLAVVANKYKSEDWGGNRVQLWGRNSSSAALMGALSISLKRWQMKNKRWFLLVLLINNRPFEKAVLPLCSEGGATATGSWERGDELGRGWGQSLALTGATDGRRAWSAANLQSSAECCSFWPQADKVVERATALKRTLQIQIEDVPPPASCSFGRSVSVSLPLHKHRFYQSNASRHSR